MEDQELLDQMAMLEGLDMVDEPVLNQATVSTTVSTVESKVTATPELTTMTTSVQDVKQEQLNNQVAAQVVQQSQTVAAPVGPNLNPDPVVETPKYINDPGTQRVTSEPKQIDLNQAPVFVNLGENTYQTKTDFLKLKENEATRVAIVNYNAAGTHFHYENGLGYFKCLSIYGDPTSDWPTIKGVCCLQPNPNDKTKVVGKGKVKVFLPVIEYPVNRADGKTIISGATPKLKVLALSKQEYDTLKEVQKEYGTDTSTFDLSITRKRSERGGFLEYKLTPGLPWRSKFNGLVEEEAKKLNNSVYNLAVEEFAKTISEERVTEFYNEKIKQDLLAQQIANQQAPTVDSLNLGI